MLAWLSWGPAGCAGSFWLLWGWHKMFPFSYNQAEPSDASKLQVKVSGSKLLQRAPSLCWKAAASQVQHKQGKAEG